MKKFIISVLSFLSTLVIVLGIYILLDPFKVIKSYDNLIDTNAQGDVGLNTDYIATTTFDKSYKKKNYNSFIFGNSRSIFYQVTDWEKHLPPNSSCYHFNANSETIYSLYKKIQYIDKKNLSIKNALLVIDYSIITCDKPRAGHLFIISPHLVNNTNVIKFHLTFLKAFLTPKFLCAYIDFKISGKIKPYMTRKNLLDDTPVNYELVTNEIRYDYFEELISQNYYYSPERMSAFYERDTMLKYSPIAINVNQKIILRCIHDIFKKHNTNFKFIISPLYDQIKLNPIDLEYLKTLFGESNVFDYSGINKFTIDYKNYYEDSHYRPHVAREILNEIYNNE